MSLVQRKEREGKFRRGPGKSNNNVVKRSFELIDTNEENANIEEQTRG
jgi:hypothetical protein